MSDIPEKTFKDGPYGSDGLVVRDAPAEQKRTISRPNSAPAYYQCRPSDLLITALSPRGKRTASNHLAQAVTSGRERTPSQHGDLGLSRRHRSKKITNGYDADVPEVIARLGSLPPCGQ